MTNISESDVFVKTKRHIMSNYNEEEFQEKQQQVIKQKFISLNRLYKKYPYLSQPKFILSYLDAQGIKGISKHKHASFIKDFYYNLYLNDNTPFSRKISGVLDSDFDVHFSVSEYLCVSRNYVHRIIKKEYVKIKKNVFDKNRLLHLSLFDPEGSNMERADEISFSSCLDGNSEFPSLSQNQILIKIFGWVDAVILSQMLYWMKENKNTTWFFSYSELSDQIHLDRQIIRKAKIWKYDFIKTTQTKVNKKKIKVEINLDILIKFLTQATVAIVPH